MIDRTGLSPPPPLSAATAPGRAADDAADAPPRLRAALGAARRHAVAALLCMATVPAAAWIALDQVTPRWSAVGSLLYAPPDYNLQELQSILRPDTTTDAIMASQAEIVRGLPAAERLVERLGLSDRPEFNRSLQPPGWSAWLLGMLRGLPPRPDPERVRDGVVQTALAHLTVKPLRASRVMEVTFATEDRALAADAANMVMSLYIDGQLETKFEAVRRAATWLDARVAELRGEVAGGEDRIAAYRAAHGLVQGVQAELGTERISRISADLAQSRNELAQAEARLAAARGREGPAAFAAIAPSVVALRAQAEQQRAVLEAMLTRFGPRHPDVIASRRRLADAERATGAESGRVAEAAEADIRADRARVAALEAGLRGAQAQTDRDAQAQVPLNAMQRDADAARTLLQTVLERVQQTAQQTAIETPDARVISQALPPSHPSFPPSAVLLAASAAIGVLLAATLVHLLELGDDTFRGGADARRKLGLPCLALIPELPRRLRKPSAAAGYVTEKPLSPYAEQVRALRAGLWLEPVPERGRAKLVAITAARPAEGKTTLAAALGRSAAMAGERVLVIDCDVREPALSRLMGAASHAGLMDVLAGAARIDDVIGRDALTSMRYLPAGSPPSNSMQQLASPGMAAALSSLRDHYELILMDAPPACGVADGRIVAGLADSTVLCVRWRHTPARSAVHALELLRAARARVAGVALTRLDARVHGRAGLADSDVYHPRYGGYFRE